MEVVIKIDEPKSNQLGLIEPKTKCYNYSIVFPHFIFETVKLTIKIIISNINFFFDKNKCFLFYGENKVNVSCGSVIHSDVHSN
uniref:Uncharacterized protein n=1 Tax=Lepeophtheirus salmonis TaxID=72036 RepID=A0A0K2UQ65_LEPSM